MPCARERPFSRCLECNGPLVTVAKAGIGHRLPPAVARLHEEFLHCPVCDKIYWKGSHWLRMRARVLGWVSDGDAVS